MNNPSCQHRRIDNDTWLCVACGERMLAQTVENETVLSAENAAGCRNLACRVALEGGTYDEANPPAGCTNPQGVYVAGPAREVIIGYHFAYECERCANTGAIFSTQGVEWECGRDHQGDSVPAPAQALT